MPLIKVWNHDRSIRKIVKVTDLKSLLNVGGQKLGYDTEELKACLETDGTDIDDEDIFQDLFNQKDVLEVIMILPKSFNWTPAYIQVQDISTEITTSNTSLCTSSSSAFSCSEEELEAENSSSSFSIPWHLLPPKFMEACQENKRPDKRQRNAAVNTICNEILAYQQRPTRKFIEKVAIDVVKRFPISLKSVIGKEHEYFFCQLENRINNESRMMNKVTLKKQLIKESEEKENLKITDSYGCVEWQPELSENETMESLQNIQKSLIQEYLISSEDEHQISCSLDKTYCLQRLKINSACTISEFKEEWPYLAHTKYLFQHANKLLGINLVDTWRNALNEKMEKFYYAIRTIAHKKPKLNKHLQELQEAVLQTHSRQPEEASFLKTVMLSFNEDAASLMQYFEKTASVDEIKSQLKKSPVIAVLGSSLFTDPEGYIFVDNEQLGDKENLTTLVVVLFGIFYIFNLQYPEGASLTMEFLQRVFYKINPTDRRSLKLKKRARTTVNPKVLSFVNFLQGQDSQVPGCEDAGEGCLEEWVRVDVYEECSEHEIVSLIRSQHDGNVASDSEGNRVAIKIVNDIAENIVEIESEYVVLSTVGGQSSLLPKYHGTYLQGKNGGNPQLWFVMELCEGVPVSELLSYLKNEGKTLQEEEIASLMKTFMMAIQHLHKNDIIYRDVRASNFILSPSGDVKLIDFGSCALVKDSDGQTHASIGTPYWMAPEVISCEQDKRYTKVCDVWSLGITAIELAEYQPPLFDIHPVRAMFQIARNPPPTLKKMAAWAEPFKDFIHECLERNPDNRPSLLELLVHPFILTVEDSSDEEINVEEMLSEDYVHTIGEKTKEILKRLGEMVEANLYPLQPSKPMTVTVKNWHFKADPDSPHFKQLPDDLAALESVTEDSALEHLLHRFSQDEIYSYIGDILLAMNPRVPLPLYDAQIQTQYWEKARSDNAPHVFAIADRAYQQMLHHKQSQVILLFGKWCSGKSFSATQIVNHLAYLCPGGNVAMAEKIQQLGPLLDAFGSAKTVYNSNASRLLKTVSITFTKTGKTTGAIINATLLDRIRISNTPEGECNFHILYYLYDGLKAEKRLSEFGLDKLSAMRYMPLKTGRNQDHSVTAYKGLYHAFRILSYTEEEILLILRILSAILLLGDVTYTMKGSMATPNNPYLIAQAAKNLSVDHDRLFKMIGTGPDIEEVMRKRDGWVQFLYLRLFDWIVSSVNATLSFSRAVIFLAHRALMSIVPFADGTGFLRKGSFNPQIGGSVYSVTVIDFPGFGTCDPNPAFRLGCNVIDDFLQNYIQQLMFFKELDEYRVENVDIPFNYEETIQQKQNRNELIDCEKTLLNNMQDVDQWSSLPADCITVDGDTVSVNHVFDKIDYSIPELQTEDLILKDEAEYLDLFQMTDDKLTSAVASNQQENTKSLGEEIALQLDKILEVLSCDYPHLVMCLLPTESLREDIKYEPEELLKQLRAFNFLETIIIRQQGFARRVTFSDFLNRYRYLAFDFDEEVELNKENSQLLLIRLKMDGWAIGSNKVFLKYFTEEYLTRLYEMYVKKLVKIQSMARRFIVKLRRERNA